MHHVKAGGDLRFGSEGSYVKAKICTQPGAKKGSRISDARLVDRRVVTLAAQAPLQHAIFRTGRRDPSSSVAMAELLDVLLSELAPQLEGAGTIIG